MIEEEYRSVFLYMMKRTRKWWNDLPPQDKHPFNMAWDDLPTTTKAASIGFWLDYLEGVGLYQSSNRR